jgi:hypothetical protein
MILEIGWGSELQNVVSSLQLENQHTTFEPFYGCSLFI